MVAGAAFGAGALPALDDDSVLDDDSELVAALFPESPELAPDESELLEVDDEDELPLEPDA